MRQNENKRRPRRYLAFLAACALAASLQGTALAFDSGKTLVPMGNAVGIELQTDGVMVVGLSAVDTGSGSGSPAEEAGIMAGDIIIRVGCTDTGCAADFTDAVSRLTGEPVDVTVRRGGRTIQYSVVPLMGSGGTYQLGLWLRDRVSGVGTLTYYDPDDCDFGALGHAITDAQTGEIMPMGGGTVTDAAIVDVVPGKAGTPGELCGVGDGADKRGDICMNSLCGIFGTLDPGGMCMREAIPVAAESEITLGKATILSTVSGRDVDEYSVEITRVYRDSGDGRSMMLTVTDPRLLDTTGGIVQGMSGSPIIQNGKLIGAVTHVLIADPTRGYGVSLEKMLATSDGAARNNAA